MIATQTQPRLNQFSWRSTPGGLYVFECCGIDWTAAVIQLAFDSVEEAESFATAAAQMAQDYRLSKAELAAQRLRAEMEDAHSGIGGEKSAMPFMDWLKETAEDDTHTMQQAAKELLAIETAPPMSEVDRLLVEAVVSSRPVETDRGQVEAALAATARTGGSPGGHAGGGEPRGFTTQPWGKCPVCTGDFGPVGNTEPCDLCRAEAANPPPVGLEEAVFGDPPPICTCNPAPELIGDRAYHQDACPMSPKMVPF